MRILNCVWLISSWTNISVSFTMLTNKNVILFTWRIFFCHNILHPVVAIKKKEGKVFVSSSIFLSLLPRWSVPPEVFILHFLNTLELVFCFPLFAWSFLESMQPFFLSLICYKVIYNRIDSIVAGVMWPQTGGYPIDICYTERFCDPSSKISSVLFCTLKIK